MITIQLTPEQEAALLESIRRNPGVITHLNPLDARVTQLQAALSVATTTLKVMALEKDAGNAEGYFGRYAESTLTAIDAALQGSSGKQDE